MNGTDAPALRFETNYALNLWVHLETACGRPRIYYSKEYDREVTALTRGLKKRFIASHRGYDYSLRMRKVASRCGDVDAFLLRVGKKDAPCRKILEEADKRYRDYWRRKAHRSVVRFSGRLAKMREEIGKVVLQIPRFTGIRQRPNAITILPVHCLSERFQFGSQPVFPDKVLVGEVDPSLVLLLLAHELIHLNAHGAITHACKTLSFPYPADVIDEVLTNVVVNAMIHDGILAPPARPPPAVETPEYARFEKQFEEVNSKLIHLSRMIPREMTVAGALKGLRESL